MGQANGMGEIEEVADNDARLKCLGGILDGLRPLGKLSDKSLRLSLLQELKIHLHVKDKTELRRIKKVGRTLRSTGTSLFMSFMEQRRAWEYWR